MVVILLIYCLGFVCIYIFFVFVVIVLGCVIGCCISGCYWLWFWCCLWFVWYCWWVVVRCCLGLLVCWSGGWGYVSVICCWFCWLGRFCLGWLLCSWVLGCLFGCYGVLILVLWCGLGGLGWFWLLGRGWWCWLYGWWGLKWYWLGCCFFLLWLCVWCFFGLLFRCFWGWCWVCGFSFDCCRLVRVGCCLFLYCWLVYLVGWWYWVFGRYFYGRLYRG